MCGKEEYCVGGSIPVPRHILQVLQRTGQTLVIIGFTVISLTRRRSAPLPIRIHTYIKGESFGVKTPRCTSLDDNVALQHVPPLGWIDERISIETIPTFSDYGPLYNFPLLN